MKAKALVLFGLAMLLAALAVGFARRSTIVQALFGNWQFVKSVQIDKGVYYRLIVKLTYKGEPQNFDIVVSCNVQQTNYKDGSRTYEVGLTPSVFGRRMSDGQGLVVRPPRACRGETTENGKILSDLLPLVVVYDDADTLAFGTAYLSDDAYENPQSVLKFGGATVERADHTAFEKFRAEQPNLVKRSSFHTPNGETGLKEAGLAAARVPMGTACYGYIRSRLEGEAKERAHNLWSAERPRYWLPASANDQSAIDLDRGSTLTDHDNTKRNPSSILRDLDVEAADQGLPRTHPMARLGNSSPVAPL